MSKVIVIVGRTKTGKSTKAKEVVLRALWPDPEGPAPDMPWHEVELLYRAVKANGHMKRLKVYDVNREWGMGALPTMDAFLAQATNPNTRGHLFVFEEATLFFDPTKGRSDELREMLVRKRHTGNALVLLFHALADVPQYVFRLTDTVVLFKTQDSFDDLRRIRHFGPLLLGFGQVSASTNPHAFLEYDVVSGESVLHS